MSCSCSEPMEKVFVSSDLNKDCVVSFKSSVVQLKDQSGLGGC